MSFCKLVWNLTADCSRDPIIDRDRLKSTFSVQGHMILYPRRIWWSNLTLGLWYPHSRWYLICCISVFRIVVWTSTLFSVVMWHQDPMVESWWWFMFTLLMKCQGGQIAGFDTFGGWQSSEEIMNLICNVRNNGCLITPYPSWWACMSPLSKQSLNRAWPFWVWVGILSLSCSQSHHDHHGSSTSAV